MAQLGTQFSEIITCNETLQMKASSCALKNILYDDFGMHNAIQFRVSDYTFNKEPVMAEVIAPRRNKACLKLVSNRFRTLCTN